MDLTLLTVPDCPHAAAFEERLAAALAGRLSARRRAGNGDHHADRDRARRTAGADRPVSQAG